MANPITPVKRFFNLLSVDKQEVMSIYAYALFNGLLGLTLPLGIQAIINFLGAGQTSTSWVVLVVFVLLGVALTGVIQIMQMAISESLQQKIFTRSAFEFSFRFPRLNMQQTRGLYLPEIANRFFDTVSVQKGLTKILLDFSGASLQIVFGLILLSLYHPFFILYSIVLVVIVYLIFRFTVPKGLETSLAESKRKYQVAHWLQDMARDVPGFKLSQESTFTMAKTDHLVSDYLRHRKAHFRTLLSQYINLVGFKVVVAAGLLLIGGLLVINQQMNIGQFVASEIIIILVLASVEKLIVSIETVYDVLTSLEKMGVVMDLPLDKSDETDIQKDARVGLDIELQSLSFTPKDGDRPIIGPVDLTIAAGEKICISGPESAGKSVFLKVLSGLYDRMDGQFIINGIPFENYSKEDWAGRVGEYLDGSSLFHGTIYDNIQLGRDIDGQRLDEIIDRIGLRKYLKKQPKGMYTMVHSEGIELPRSVRIKIGLARALAQRADLIVIDDQFHNLSRHDQDELIKYFKSLPSTVVVVSNRIEVAKQFNRSILIQEGLITSDLRDATESDLSKLLNDQIGC